MKSVIHLILAALLILNSNLNLFAANGNTAVNFLSQNLSARSVAMGGLYTATAQGVEAITTNPTGISLRKSNQVLTSFASTTNGSAHGFAGYAHPFQINSLRLGLGAAVSYFSAGNIDINYADGTSESINAERSYAASLGMSLKYRCFGIGISPKIIRSTLVQRFTGVAYAADIGFLFYPLPSHFNNRLILGAAVQNLGSQISYKIKKHDLPTNRSFGASLIAMENSVYGSVLLSTQGELMTGENFRFKLGGEYTLRTSEELRFFFFRGGYRFQYDNEDYSVGVGFSDKNFELHYSFVNGSILDNSHLFSIGYKFGTFSPKVVPDSDIEESKKAFYDQEILKNQIIVQEEIQKHELISTDSQSILTQEDEKDRDVLEIKKDMMESGQKSHETELINEESSDLNQELINQTEEDWIED